MNKASVDIPAENVDSKTPLTRKKTSRVVTWGGFVIAFLILINPMPMLFDLLPDAFAFLIILYSLRRAVGEIDIFDDLKQSTRKLLILTACKIPAFFVMVFIWGGDSRERSIVAVFTLCFSIVEFIFLRTWTHDFFDATARFGQRYNCDAALSGRNTISDEDSEQLARRKRRSAHRVTPEKLELFTLIFFFLRSCLSCLPEMSLVPYYDNALNSTTERFFNWNIMYPFLAILGSLAALVLGIIWVLYAIPYVRRISRDKAANLRMCDDITFGSRAERANDNRLIRAITFLLVGVVILQFDLVLDNVNYIPDILSALLLFAAGYSLHSLLGRHHGAYVLPISYAVSTLAYTVFQTIFYNKFNDEKLAEHAEGARLYFLPVALLGLVSSLLLIASCIYIFLALKDVVTRYTGLSIGGLTEKELNDRLRHVSAEESLSQRSAYTYMSEKTKRSLNKGLLAFTIIGSVVACLTAAADLIMFKAPPPMEGIGQDPGFMTLLCYGGIDSAVIVAVIVWLAMTLYIGSRIRREAELNLIEE